MTRAPLEFLRRTAAVIISFGSRPNLLPLVAGNLRCGRRAGTLAGAIAPQFRSGAAATRKLGR